MSDRRQKQARNNMIFLENDDSSNCCIRHNAEDDYQLITECWIEPQHGSVVVNKKQNNTYMSGLMYEQLADGVSTQLPFLKRCTYIFNERVDIYKNLYNKLSKSITFIIFPNNLFKNAVNSIDSKLCKYVAIISVDEK